MGCRLAFGSAIKGYHHQHSPNAILAAVRGTPSSRVPKQLLTMSGALQTTPEVCTLDCTGTIMRIKGSIPRLYLGVLEEHLGVHEGAIPGVSEENLLKSFGTSFKSRSRELPCFGSGVMSSEEWWTDIVRATFRGAGVAEDSLEGVFDEVFKELFHSVFTSQEAWELVPGAEGVIHDLRDWCREDGGPMAFGVVSNFDERLHPLLKNLGVYDYFDFVLTSRECGSGKPDPHMFREALKRARAGAGARTQRLGGSSTGVHIGDNFDKDVLGAQAAGWDSVLITKKPPTDEEERGVEHTRVDNLVEVPVALGIRTR